MRTPMGQKPSLAVVCLAIATSPFLLDATVRGDGMWTKVGESGFGDTQNHSVLAMQVFDRFLYAATQNSAGGSQVWKLKLETDMWRQVTPSWSTRPDRVEAMAVFRGSLYLGTDSGEIWRTAGEFRPCIPVSRPPSCLPVPGLTPIELWSRVVVRGSGGFWQPTKITSMVVFDNALYLAKVGPASQGPGPGLEIWRTVDGSAWRRVIAESDGVNNYSANLAVYNGQVYAATSRATPGLPAEPGEGSEVWRSRDGLRWEPIVATEPGGALLPSGFGDNGNTAVTDLAVFNGRLYLTTVNHKTQADIWRFDGSVWEDVTPAMSPARLIPRFQSLAVFAGRIFVGEGIRSAFDAQVSISATGRVWSDDGLPEVGTSIDAMETSPRHLYVAVKNDETGVEIWRRAGPSADFCLIRPELCGIF